MVAYNFQTRFADPIKRGEKSHTIRKHGKRRHARPGEALQLYTGMRTRNCQKILKVDPVCVFCESIDIDVGPFAITAICVGGQPVDDLEAFAIADGFASLDDMHAFWLDFHGIGIFQGAMIGWEQGTQVLPTETIHWIDAAEELPDSGSEVLVCYERNDCEDRDVAIAGYDDSYEGESPWEVSGGLMSFGTVLFWAELPAGPIRSKGAKPCKAKS